MSGSPPRSPPVLQRSHSLSSLPPCRDPWPDWTQGSGNEQNPGTQDTNNTSLPSKKQLRQQAKDQEVHHTSETTAGCRQDPTPSQEVISTMSGQRPSGSVDKERGSGESEEDSDSDDLGTSLDEQSILERLGLNSMQLTEEETESAFAQLSLAFRCDQYTLKRRLQAEERARDVAEENFRQELENGRATLQTLKGLFVDSKRGRIVQKLEQSLEVLSNTIERISSTAELLGAVHQEARVSHAVELMVAHVENLKRRHARDQTELEETKRMVLRNSRSRRLSESQEDGDLRQKTYLRHSQHGARRRVSIAVIPKQAQLHSSDSRGSDDGKSSVETDFFWALGDASQPSSRQPIVLQESSADSSSPEGQRDPSPLPATGHPGDSNCEKEDLCSNRSAQQTLRFRRRSKEVMQPGLAGEGLEALEEFSDHDTFALERCAHSIERRPLLHGLWQCGWFLLWLFLMAVACTLLTAILLWRLRPLNLWA
nr:PREDICTED: lymphoid-restricted membrane protein-like isoform X1 [Lepisosteus oculatus]